MPCPLASDSGDNLRFHDGRCARGDLTTSRTRRDLRNPRPQRHPHARPPAPPDRPQNRNTAAESDPVPPRIRFRCESPIPRRSARPGNLATSRTRRDLRNPRPQRHPRATTRTTRPPRRIGTPNQNRMPRPRGIRFRCESPILRWVGRPTTGSLSRLGPASSCRTRAPQRAPAPPHRTAPHRRIGTLPQNRVPRSLASGSGTNLRFCGGHSSRLSARDESVPAPGRWSRRPPRPSA